MSVWLHLVAGFRERLLADTGFFVKVSIELGIGLVCKLTAEYGKRGKAFKQELDFVFANVVSRVLNLRALVSNRLCCTLELEGNVDMAYEGDMLLMSGTLLQVMALIADFMLVRAATLCYGPAPALLFPEGTDMNLFVHTATEPYARAPQSVHRCNQSNVFKLLARQVWLPAPTLSFAAQQGSKTQGGLARFLRSCPDNAFQVIALHIAPSCHQRRRDARSFANVTPASSSQRLSERRIRCCTCRSCRRAVSRGRCCSAAQRSHVMVPNSWVSASARPCLASPSRMCSWR